MLLAKIIVSNDNMEYYSFISSYSKNMVGYLKIKGTMTKLDS